MEIKYRTVFLSINSKYVRVEINLHFFQNRTFLYISDRDCSLQINLRENYKLILNYHNVGNPAKAPAELPILSSFHCPVLVSKISLRSTTTAIL